VSYEFSRDFTSLFQELLKKKGKVYSSLISIILLITVGSPKNVKSRIKEPKIAV